MERCLWQESRVCSRGCPSKDARSPDQGVINRLLSNRATHYVSIDVKHQLPYLDGMNTFSQFGTIRSGAECSQNKVVMKQEGL